MSSHSVRPIPLAASAGQRWRRWCLSLAAALLVACGGADSGGAASSSAASSAPADAAPLAFGGAADSKPAAAPVLSAAPSMTESIVPAAVIAPPTPRASLRADELGLVVIEGDALGESIAAAYQRARGIPAAHVVRVSLPRGQDEITPAELAAAKAQVDARLPASVQATLLTFTQPSRVRGGCTMSITSALALGFDLSRCGGCARTQASPYFDSESTRPYQDLGLRPSMMLGATSLAEAEVLIARGLAAEASHPAGTGWLIRTADSPRSVRHADWAGLPQWAAEGGFDLRMLDASAPGSSPQPPAGSASMFQFTGLDQVPGLDRLDWRPGAVADHLTSYGGVLPLGHGQMTVLSWLRAGATASYGTVEEPCNWTQKFPQVSVLLAHYLRGSTVIEAYWKSVAWPGQGLFVGDPLARPWTDAPSSRIEGSQWVLQTRALRSGARYQAQWRSDAQSPWQTLAALVPDRPGPVTWRVTLPSGAGQLRWLGPCGADASQSCVMGHGAAGT